MNEGDIARMSLRRIDKTSQEYTEYLAAKHAADTLTAHEITDWVDSLADAGVWVDSFLDIMDADFKSAETLLPMFTKCLSELGIRVPSQEQYPWWLIRYHLKRIDTEEVDPLEGMTSFWEDTWQDNQLNAATSVLPFQERRFGGMYDIYPFISLYWSWDDVRERHFDYSEAETETIRQEIEKSILREAKIWLSKHNEVCN